MMNFTEVKECSMKEANELLANGWQLISAGVMNWSDNNSGTTWFYSEVIYILGKLQPSHICQNCGTNAQVGWHEVRDGVDSVVCHVGDDNDKVEF